jgi:hypothetical protein
MNTYTVKVPTSFPAVSSAQVHERLREFLASRNASRIAADPGAGDRVLRLSLPGDLIDALATKLGDPPAVALRRLIATHGHDNPAHAQAVPISPAPDSWFERHLVLTLLLIFAGIVGLLWLLSRRNGKPPLIPGPSVPELFVSEWSPLQ